MIRLSAPPWSDLRASQHHTTEPLYHPHCLFSSIEHSFISGLVIYLAGYIPMTEEEELLAKIGQLAGRFFLALLVSVSEQKVTKSTRTNQPTQKPVSPCDAQWLFGLTVYSTFTRWLEAISWKRKGRIKGFGWPA